MNNIKLKLRLTDNLENINSLIIKLKKPLYKYKKKDILLQILTDEYSLLKYDLIIKLKEDYLEDYDSLEKINKHNLLKIQSNQIIIDKYVLLPIAKYYNYNILSYLFFYYYLIKNDLPNKKEDNITIIKIIGPWEIKNDILHLYFELEDFLINENKINYKNINTVFLYIDYGTNINIPTKYNINENKYNFKIFNINNINETDISKFINNSTHILVDSIKLYDTISCNNEIASLPLMIYIYNIALKNLSINGNLYILLNSYYLLYPSLELFYYIYSLFEKIKVLDNKLCIDKIGFIKFSSYTKKNDLDIIINKYKSYDKYLGQNLLISKMNEYYCIPKYSNKRKPNTKYLIKSLFDDDSFIDKKFLQFFNNIYYKKNKRIKQTLSKIKNLNLKNIDSILSDNISKCIDFCKLYNIDIHDNYNKFKPINYKNLINTYFINKPNINRNKILLSIDSIFSITKPKLTIEICDMIKKNMPNVEYIIDGTSNIGSTSIIFTYYFKYVYAVEYNDITFNNLKNNIQVYKLKNIKVYLDDIIKFMNNINILNEINYNIHNYCLFLDPPWGGIHYKLEKNINLMLSDIDILDFILKLNIKYIVIKVPFNYNFKKLYKLFSNLSIFKLEGFYVILIIK